jgi:ferredoxin
MKLLLLTAAIYLSLNIFPALLLNDPASFMFAAGILTWGGILLLVLPISGVSHITVGKPPRHRFHEEDAVLSRRLLEPGTDAYKAYYKKYPERRDPDDQARNNPGLLSPASSHHHPVTYAAAHAGFTVTGHLHSLEATIPADHQEPVDPVKLKQFISDWLQKSGAKQVGFTALRDHHLYSHKGRGPRKGEKIHNTLPHAIAFTVEMDHGMMQYAPAGPTVMESSDQYLSSGVMATKLALMIKQLGYQARAHTDGNYEVICPLVAADAGLGVIGRMGLLMTPSLGPRVRTAVVTTDLPLEYTQINSPANTSSSVLNRSTIDFCKRCKKCAVVCPANAIPEGPVREHYGTVRWKINSERCYNFWTVSGTDCGRCVISCPFSHPDNWLHRLIRRGVKNNLLFRIIAVKLDDVFYGRKPAVKRLPDRYIFFRPE